MLHPSYTDLINAVNSGAAESGDEPVVQSRYSIVIATAKRARQIIAGDAPMHIIRYLFLLLLKSCTSRKLRVFQRMRMLLLRSDDDRKSRLPVL